MKTITAMQTKRTQLPSLPNLGENVFQKIKCTLAATAFLLLGLMPAMALATDVTTYFHNDPGGSPAVATDAGGNVVWKASYQPYGKEIDQAAAGANNEIWFHGKPYEQSTGLSYFGARYYDPVVGRFAGFDPVGFDEKNLHSFNRYAYGNNNPYRFVDPDGREPIGALTDRDTSLMGILLISHSINGGHGFGAAGLAGPILNAVGLETKAAATVTRSVTGEAGTIAIAAPYARPSGATTAAQRASVQGKPCVDCGATTSRQVADHKEPLVKEYYRTGTIDKDRMRSVDAVQPQCPTCSARQGAEMQKFSREMKKEHGLE